MYIKNYEVSNPDSSILRINYFKIDKDRENLGPGVFINTYSTSSIVQLIKENDNSISNYKEINDNSTINNIVNDWKNRNYGKIYDIQSNNAFFLLDENDNNLQSKTPFHTTWLRQNNYDYFNIPMNIFVPKKSDTPTPQCDYNTGLQEINTNIKMINNFYTNKFIPTTIKYTYSNKCNTLPLSDHESVSMTIPLTEYSTDHNIFVPGAIKKIERDKDKINVWYYKINNLFANSYTNDIITISTPTNINLYQANNDGSLTKKNVNLPYDLPQAATPDPFIQDASNLPPSLPNQNHYGLYSYADDNKLKLTCKDNDFLAGYSLTYKNDKYIIKPYCIHYSTTEVEDNQPPLQINCEREEYLGHVYEETVPGTDFVIKDDNNEIYRHCYDGKWDEPKYTNNCGVIDGEIWEGGEERTIEDNGNKYGYICKSDDNIYFTPTLIEGKCSTDNGEYNIGESYSTSCAIGEKGVKYYKCDEDGMKEINNCVKVCTHDNKEYNIGEFYSSSCNVGEKGSKIYACDNNGEWKLINGCKNTDGSTSTNTNGSTSTNTDVSTSTNTDVSTSTNESTNTDTNVSTTTNTNITTEETADNNMILIILIVIGILILFIVLIIVIISSKVKRNKKKNSN